METLLYFVLFILAVFLIVLILIQRGKGGGLAGALGGMGGQSAFGTKAGDLFTRITIGVAAVWILVCMISVRMLGSPKSALNPDLGQGAPAKPPASAPAATDNAPEKGPPPAPE
jgi:preprotein translocase subunit SecG